MMKVLCLLAGVFAIAACARVNVVAPKEAIKLDVSMRLDVYQHVAKDADNIEDAVAGGPVKTAAPKTQSFLSGFITEAYAQDEGGFGPDVQAAIDRRKARRSQLHALEAQGAIGENASALVVVRSGSSQDLVSAENSDRMVIFNALAAKNGTSVADVQKVYAQKIQEHSPAGTPIETPSGWTTK